MTRFVKAALAVAAVGMLAASSHAGSFSIVPSIAGWLDEALSPVAPPAAGTNPGVPYVVQVDFDVVVDSLGAGEDSFGNTGSNVALEGGAADYLDLGWQANNPTVDTNGALPLGQAPLFGQNGDFGASATDEQGILVSMATGAFTNAADPRRNVGEPGGIRGLLGTLFIRWDGTGEAKISVVDAQASAKLTTGAFVGNQDVVAGSITLGGPAGPIIPEPGTLAMAGMAVIGLVLRRRAA